MGSGDSLQDWSSDSISSHHTQVRSPAVQVLHLQLAQAPIALSLRHFVFFLTWYVMCIVQIHCCTNCLKHYTPASQ